MMKTILQQINTHCAGTDDMIKKLSSKVHTEEKVDLKVCIFVTAFKLFTLTKFRKSWTFKIQILKNAACLYIIVFTISSLKGHLPLVIMKMN